MNLNYQAPINSLGYGVVGKNLLTALSKDNEVALWIIGKPQLNNSINDVAFNKLVEKSIKNTETYDVHAPSILVWHQFEMAKHIGKGLHCGFPIFELNKFKQKACHHLSQLDIILVASQWAKNVVNKNIVHNYIYVCPLGVNNNIFKPSKILKNDSSTTRFINIGKWEKRKGHDILVHAFNKAFSKNDDVALYMLNDNPFVTQEQTSNWHKLYKESKLGNKINLVGRLSTQYDVANLINKMDCGVFPSRAEGWNLELLETMACGKQVIATNYSGHTEFCDSDNSLLIDIDTLEKAHDGIWFNGEGEWASIGHKQIDQLAEHMKTVHEQKQKGISLYNQKGVNTGSKYSWDYCAQNILSAWY